MADPDYTTGGNVVPKTPRQIAAGRQGTPLVFKIVGVSLLLPPLTLIMITVITSIHL